MSALEKSLDELIGDHSKPRSRDSRRPPSRPRRDRERSRERRPQSRDFRDRYEPPRQTKLQRLSHGKAYLKITNLHYEIGEQDLKSLFETVGETSFVLIEYNHSGRSSGVAYVGYEDQDNNETAVQKFDKKKAVGEIISVEEIKPLNVLIAPRGTRSGTPRGSRASRGETRGGHRTKKPSMDELDEELNRYMNKEDDKPQRPVKSNGKHSKPTIEDLDKELDDYMKTDQPFPATGAE